jgi:hypothetical protein
MPNQRYIEFQKLRYYHSYPELAAPTIASVLGPRARA